MTDVVYIVRPSGWNYDEELRYSLRSLAMYAHNIGRVIVCGDIPAFLSDEVIKVSCSNPYDRKAKNLQYRLDTVIDKCNLKEPFLLSADDIFLSAKTDLDLYPHFWKNGAEIGLPDEYAQTHIGRIITAARDLLRKHGYSINDYGGGHCLHWVYPYLWNYGMNTLKDASAQSKYGVPVDLMLGAAINKVHSLKHIIRTDYKFDSVQKDLQGVDCFSIEDRPDLWGGDKWLQELYPNKCIYER
jgi:hypothetical protein